MSKRKNGPIKNRSQVARAAYERNGAGMHRTDPRRKPRGQSNRDAIRRSSDSLVVMRLNDRMAG